MKVSQFQRKRVSRIRNTNPITYGHGRPVAPFRLMKVGVTRETVPGERRVALVPELVHKMIQSGMEILVEPGSGIEAGFRDSRYAEQGARIQPQVLRAADVILKVRPPTPDQISELRENSFLIGLLEPYSSEERLQVLAAQKVTALAMELMPRIARAQSMDALSAMSTVAGYKAVLLAANHLPKFFPLLMTAAGTVPPARVFVVGAGVAGLEAIGTAKRLGAVVEAYDTRSAVREEVQSVGGRFIELDLNTVDAEEQGGYARAQSAEFYKKQQVLMMAHVRTADVVITAALVRGQRAPVLVSEEMIQGMRPGSVVVDLAADQGGNCALTQPGRDVEKYDVTILGPLNLPSTMPFHASEMYARTAHNFLMHLFHNGSIQIDPTDELVRATLLTHRGKVVNEACSKRSMA